MRKIGRKKVRMQDQMEELKQIHSTLDQDRERYETIRKAED